MVKPYDTTIAQRIADAVRPYEVLGKPVDTAEKLLDMLRAIK